MWIFPRLWFSFSAAGISSSHPIGQNWWELLLSFSTIAFSPSLITAKTGTRIESENIQRHLKVRAEYFICYYHIFFTSAVVDQKWLHQTWYQLQWNNIGLLGYIVYSWFLESTLSSTTWICFSRKTISFWLKWGQIFADEHWGTKNSVWPVMVK